jgi:Holliday junction resolvasome RuvABC endonuclease subunit
MKKILCLDLGTKTGFALIENNKVIKSGTKNFQPTRFQSSDYRFVVFRNFLKTFLPLDQVYFEEVRRHIGVDAAHCYGGFKAVLTTFCQDNDVNYCGIAVGTIKKSITGNGAAKKDAVIKAVQDRGFSPIDDNEADAIAIALHVIKLNLLA